MRWLFRIALLVLPFLFVACEPSSQMSSVPSFPVRYSLDLVAEYPHFVPDNGFQCLTFTQPRYDMDAVGYSGLVVWVDMAGRYHAADLCCPHCLRRTNRIEVDGIFARCPMCGEEYDLSYGLAVPMHGKSDEPLRFYTTFIQGTKLIIRN